MIWGTLEEASLNPCTGRAGVASTFYSSAQFPLACMGSNEQLTVSQFGLYFYAEDGKP